MNDFFQSKFVKDLQNGKLPPVEVELQIESIIQASAVFGITAIIVILVASIFRKS